VHLQFLARCRARDGHFVAATELWRQILSEGAPPGASQAIVIAVNEANAQLQRTLPRLARSKFFVRDAYPDLELSLDGAELPPEVIKAPLVLDPGHHLLEAHAPGYAPFTREWTLSEGGTREIVIALEKAAGETSPSPAFARSPEGEGAHASNKMEIAGWITASAGGVALVAGTVTWLTRNNKRTELENDCPDFACTQLRQTDLDDRKDSVRSLTTATNILMFGGGALLAGGVMLVVVGKSSAKSGSARASTTVMAGAPATPAGLSVFGRF
jgi:hypothetical protein